MKSNRVKYIFFVLFVTIFSLTCDSTEFECEQHNISECNSDDKTVMPFSYTYNINEDS